MKHFKIFILPFFVIMMTGCWNYRELEDLAIVGAIGVDYSKGNFNISAEVLNPKKVAINSGTSGGGGSDETPSVVYEAKGKTIREALNNIILDSPKNLYIGHLDLLVISDEVARKGIMDVADFFMRDVESRKIFPVVVVKNTKAAEALKVIKQLDTVTSSNIQASLEVTSTVNGIVSNFLFDEILMSLYTQGRSSTISAVEVINLDKKGESNSNLGSTQAKTTVKIVGYAAFKGDKLVGYLDEKESLGYTIIRDKIDSMTVSFPCDDIGNYGNIVFDIIKTDLGVKLIKDKPVAKIDVSGRAALIEYNCKNSLRDEKNIVKIKKTVESELDKLVKKIIVKTQTNLKTDILGFGEQLYKNNNSYWRKNKKNWSTIFPTVEYKIKSDVTIDRIGSTIDTTKEGGK